MVVGYQSARRHLLRRPRPRCAPCPTDCWIVRPAGGQRLASTPADAGAPVPRLLRAGDGRLLPAVPALPRTRIATRRGQHHETSPPVEALTEPTGSMRAVRPDDARGTHPGTTHHTGAVGSRDAPAAAVNASHNDAGTTRLVCSRYWTAGGGDHQGMENVSMPEHDLRPATHATSTSALQAVAVLLAVVLLMAAATTVLDALPTPRRPGAEAEAEHTERPVRHRVQVDVPSSRLAADARP
jgi:hypothetical protein